MGLPIQFTKILTAANSTVIATVQARASAGNVTLSSTPVILDSQRRVAITLTASNSGAALVLSGTNDGGTAISENITVGATVTALVSQMDYKTVTALTSTTLTGNISVGSSATGSTPWQMANPWADPCNINVGVTVTLSNGVTYSAEYTMDIDPCGVKSNAPLTACNAFTAGLLSALTTSASALITGGNATSQHPVPCTAWRLTISGTSGVQVSALEAGAGNG